MADITFTKQQKSVITHRTCNLLVSAAAGSGKTAVLVQRIMELVLNAPNRTDIDRILVVTFTRNAAAQMKERIMDALSARLAEKPDDAHLLRQMNLVHYANITTIDSFCQSIVKSYFQEADIDPNFRIGDEAELRLLWEQALLEELEAAHKAGEPAFWELVNAYGGSRSDEKIVEMITRLNSFAQSSPWPDLWLRNSVRMLCEEGDIGKTEVAKEACLQAKQRLQGALEKTQEAIFVCERPDGPLLYAQALRDDEDFLRLALKKETYAELAELFSQQAYTPLSRKRQPEASEEKKQLVQAKRKEAKAIVQGVKDSYFFQDISEMKSDMALCATPMKTLLSLTEKCRKRYREALQKNNVLGFSEVEHLALSILLRREEDGTLLRTAAANAYAEQFDEIMIDEYQDSNLVQDLLLTAISGEASEHPNLFVVGDVKQSIYKFRMARPELFLERYRRYPEDGEKECRIDLSMNFRSRKTVLACVNRIFERIMTAELGGISYDEKAALYPGAAYPDVWEREKELTELILLDPKEDEGQAEAADEATDEELYVQAVAERIGELVRPDSGYRIKDGGSVRPVAYGDIVVLVRSLNGIAKPLVQGLLQRGIDAYVTTMEGYFTAVEVQTILNVLRILDNPLQDIPMAAVLHSPIADFSDEELARLRILSRRFARPGRITYLYDTLRDFAAFTKRTAAEEALFEKTVRFLSLYDELLQKKQTMRVFELLEEIYQTTGYLLYCQAMPGGETRKNHLEALVRKARDFQNFAYTELCDFVSYIDHMITYQVKVEEASPADSGGAVRIMTIHASKGLEFPIVLLPDLHRKFNLTDTTGTLLLHEDLGLGPIAIDQKQRTKVDTLAKKVIACRIRQDSLGEELRILYTAMTRAKEKLILFGVKRGICENLEAGKITPHQAGAFSFGQLYSAGCYLDWILPSVLASEQPSLAQLADMAAGDPFLGKEFMICVKNRRQLLDEFASHAREELTTQEGAREPVFTKEAVRIPEILATWEDYEYPYRMGASLPIRLSVSALKASAMQEEDAFAASYNPQERETEKEERIPKFLQEKERETILRGSERGTLYHKILEIHDFTAEPSLAFLQEELQKAIALKKIPKDAKNRVSLSDFLVFFESPLGQRLQKAARAGRLHKEQNFVLSYPARELSLDYESDEPILVQGIIDVFFEEDDGVVLLDYKTDRVFGQDAEEVLRRRYRAQLAYYADAITRGTGKMVKERLIYSFALQKSFSV